MEDVEISKTLRVDSEVDIAVAICTGTAWVSAVVLYDVSGSFTASKCLDAI